MSYATIGDRELTRRVVQCSLPTVRLCVWRPSLIRQYRALAWRCAAFSPGNRSFHVGFGPIRGLHSLLAMRDRRTYRAVDDCGCAMSWFIPMLGAGRRPGRGSCCISNGYFGVYIK